MALPTVTVEVAFSAGASTGTLLFLDDPGRGLLDTGTLASDVTWTDVSDFVLGVSTRRGSNRVTSPLIRYEAGTATIVLDNSDRRFDPANLAGPYVALGTSQVTPMRAVRVRATWAGVIYDLFRGFADEWRIRYDDPSWSTVTLTASDAFKVLGNIDRLAGPSVGDGELSGNRVNRVLDSAAWPAGDRHIGTLFRFGGLGQNTPADPGDSTLQATTLSGNVLSELQLIEDSELGELYVDGAGRVVFRNRHGLTQNPNSIAPQSTFGDGGGAELPYESVEVAYDDAPLANRARISRAGGVEQQADDATSQALYMIRVLKRDGLLMQTDASANDYADYVVYIASQPELRFASMTVFPREQDTNLFPQVLGREIGDRITIVRRPPGGGAAITRDVFIRGIEHQVGDEQDWRTVWTLQSATPYIFLVLDDAGLGKLDTDVLAY